MTAMGLTVLCGSKRRSERARFGARLRLFLASLPAASVPWLLPLSPLAAARGPALALSAPGGLLSGEDGS
jgi:hypothetical protein